MNHTHSAAAQRQLCGLDGLRGVACLMVFGVHFGQIAKLYGNAGPFDLARLIENGNSGVALFFGLSGFLLGLPFWRAMLQGRALPSIGRYFAHRLARVVPAYFLCLTALIVANRLWLERDWQRDALLHYAFAFNFFDTSIFSINPPFWTVAVEMQFYLLLPVLFFGCWRLRADQAAVGAVVLAIVAYAAHGLIAANSAARLSAGDQLSPVLTYSLLAHLPHFLLGVVTGWFFTRHSRLNWSPSEKTVLWKEVALWLSGALLLVIFATPLDELLQVPYGRYNLPVVPLLFCLVIVLAPLTATGWLLLHKSPLRGVGCVSYGVYLYHLPVLHVVARILPRYAMNAQDDWFVFAVTSLSLTLGVATLSYHLFEKPIRRLVTGQIR
ncbi:MAG: hypothetical protein BWK72_07350 [Rhodoferax ferrireducens]|uniref:Acyltransferase 3 domain-containing protein n=2 Tax=Pseudomonadota TaxID=1224 RepID=A0A1Y1R075_9GAMM|nr:MAG: hypothetical protein BWK72_07350 [Rhodoferax ferrireducens]OQX17316.1 MAG: hypothetical protein BWK73_01120 [Thiothrix lacustris]